MTKLTAKQEMFCKEYLIDLNATQAAIRSGYSEKTACAIGLENLGKPVIQVEIQRNMNKRSKKTEITAEYVLNNIKEINDRCMQRTAVYDKDGNKTGEYVFKETGALKAQELLGRHLKMFTDKTEHSGEIDGGKTQVVIVQNQDGQKSYEDRVNEKAERSTVLSD